MKIGQSIVLSKTDISDLPLTSITVKGFKFETGVPVTFPFMRNTVSSKTYKLIDKKRFQQDIEPAGMYMSFDETPDSPVPTPDWIKGEMQFKHPLVLAWGKGYDENSWKAHLFKKYGKKGKALSSKIKADGYDGIVTVDGRFVSEIVKL